MWNIIFALYCLAAIAESHTNGKLHYRRQYYFVSDAFERSYFSGFYSACSSQRKKFLFDTSLALKPSSDLPEGKKFKVINPNEINKIFENNFKVKDDLDQEEEDDEVDMDEDEIIEEEGLLISDMKEQDEVSEEVNEFSLISGSSEKSINPQQDIFNEREVMAAADKQGSSGKESQILLELEALNAMNGLQRYEEEIKVTIVASDVEEKDDDFGYGSLNQKLDKVPLSCFLSFAPFLLWFIFIYDSRAYANLSDRLVVL